MIMGGGGIAGLLLGESSIDRCAATGSIGSGPDAGGLVGVAQEGHLADSYFAGSVESASGYSGGLVGVAAVNTVERCYVSGVVTGSGGGLIGACRLGSSILASFFSGDVVGDVETTGGLIGRQESGCVVTDGFWLDFPRSVEACYRLGAGSSDDGCTEIRDGSYFQIISNPPLDAWDFLERADDGRDDIWRQALGPSLPILTWQTE